jgi:hypothetical protein
MMMPSLMRRQKEKVRPTRREKHLVKINPRTHQQLVVTLREILSIRRAWMKVQQ